LIAVIAAVMIAATLAVTVTTGDANAHRQSIQTPYDIGIIDF
jgi:hypothetical protein